MAQATMTRSIPDGSTLMQANAQWRSRPDDERYLTLEALAGAARAQRERSRECVLRTEDIGKRLRADGDEVYLQGSGAVKLSHHAFGQLATIAGAPAGYLRRLPTQMAALNLQWGLEHGANDQAKILVEPGNGETPGWARAFTGPGYGRIWDGGSQGICDALEDLKRRTGDVWKVPAASYSASDPKRATTLYRSAHDMFAFLVDPSRPVEVGNESLFRGFMVWNSETGARTFGMLTFLYRYVCDNRMVWGVKGAQELIIRHTSGGPARFAEFAAPALRAYSEGSTVKLEDQIKSAQHAQVAKSANEAVDWLKAKGFGAEVSKLSVGFAEREEGNPTTVWNLVQGLTAYARGITHTDDRVDLERKAGALMNAF